MNKDALRDLLVKHEGLKLKVYKDSLGISTIGIGRNIEGQGITEQEAYYLFENDLSRVVAECISAFSWFDRLSDARQNVIADMAFNMGIDRLKGFHKMLECVQTEDFDMAAQEMISSQWAVQVGVRALNLAAMMRLG